MVVTLERATSIHFENISVVLVRLKVIYLGKRYLQGKH